MMGCSGLCCENFGLMDSDRAQFDEIDEDLLILLGPDPRKQYPDRYTCAAWDRDTLKCEMYEDRPQLCRDFPEPGKVCVTCV